MNGRYFASFIADPFLIYDFEFYVVKHMALMFLNF